MIIYLLFFTISFTLIYLSEKYKGNKKIHIVLELAGITTLAFLGGIRDLNIGTDVKTYVYPVFLQTLMSGLQVFTTSSLEIGYLLLNYLVSLLCNRVSLLLFVTQFIIMYYSYQGIKAICKEKALLGYAVFTLLFYNMSYNIVRQFIAIAFLLYSLKFLLEKNYLKTVFIIILASFFHESSLIFLISIPLHKYKNKIVRNDIVLFILCLSLGIFSSVLFGQILTALVGFGIIPEQYLYYLNHYVNEKIDFQIIYILLDMIFIFLFLMRRNKQLRNMEDSSLFYAFLTFDILFLLIGAKHDVINRMGLFFRTPSYIYFFTRMDIFIKEEKKKKIFNYAIIALCLLIWIYVYVIGKSGSTYPYKISNDLLIRSIIRW